MTVVNEPKRPGEVESLVGCEVITPGHQGYDDARSLWNAMIDRRPGAIVMCQSPEDVAATVGFARENGFKIAVKGGGHSVRGASMCDDELVVDLSNMRTVEVDPEAQLARVAGGALLRDLDTAALAHGMTAPAGAVSHTGVAGLTLGGGLGHLTRKLGLSIDSVLAMEVVTADGVVRHVDADHDADLFWALRGGGGNFGVVTEFTFRLHELEDPYIAIVMHPLAEAPALLRRWRDVMTADEVPDDLNWGCFLRQAAGIPGIPDELVNQPVVMSLIEWYGDRQEGRRLIDGLLAEVGGAMQQAQVMPFLAYQQIADDALAKGNPAYAKAGFFDTMSDELIDAVVEAASRVVAWRSTFEMMPLGGAIRNADADATAFAHRNAAFVFNIIGVWDDFDDNDANIAWVREAYRAVEPFSSGAAYINYMGGDEPNGVRAAHGSGKALARLREAKLRYDPQNMFCFDLDLTTP